MASRLRPPRSPARPRCTLALGFPVRVATGLLGSLLVARCRRPHGLGRVGVGAAPRRRERALRPCQWGTTLAVAKNAGFNMALGLLALVISPALTHAMSAVRRAFSRVLLTDEASALRDRAAAAEASRAALSRAEARTLSKSSATSTTDRNSAWCGYHGPGVAAAASVGRRGGDGRLVDEPSSSAGRAGRAPRALPRESPPRPARSGAGGGAPRRAARCPVDTVVDMRLDPQPERLGTRPSRKDALLHRRRSR